MVGPPRAHSDTVPGAYMGAHRLARPEEPCALECWARGEGNAVAVGTLHVTRDAGQCPCNCAGHRPRQGVRPF